MKRTILAITMVASITAAASTADARPSQRHAAQSGAQVTCTMHGCSDNPSAVAARKAHRGGRASVAQQADSADVSTQAYAARAERRGRRHAALDAATQIDANGNSVIVGGRPAGCPRQFCGCEASLHVFGKIIPELNLAANWRKKFPRTQPASGMVAARSGHVFVLMSHVEGNKWLVHDGNSGGGKTRRHVRSIAGYTIVNPHASQMASN